MPTNVYDVTFPPDTQLANLLGQDLRNFRLDVQQRMALISGTLATRWNPATDAQPANWTGLLYHATDTGQIFQWNGAAWVDVSASFIQLGVANIQANLAGVVGNSADQTLFTFNVPAGAITASQAIRLTAAAQHTVGAFNTTWKLSLNGVFILNFANVTLGVQNIVIANTGAATGVFIAGSVTLGSLAGLNWAGVQALTLTFNAPNTDTVVPFLWVVEFLR